MKTIYSIRNVIGNIPGAIYNLPPDEIYRGNELGVQTLWTGDEPDLDKLSYDSVTDAEPPNSEFLPAPTQIEEIFEIGADIDTERLVASFGGLEGERIKKSIECDRGTDALAWYVTFHGKGVQWGIYVPMLSIGYVMNNVLGRLDCDLVTKFRLAFRMLHQHELFHFATDYMASQLEAIVGAPCHKPARELKDEQLGYILLEEQLANAHMIRSFRSVPRPYRVSGTGDAIRKFVKAQPPGYRDGIKSISPDMFLKGCDELGRNYGECIPHDPRGLGAVDLTALYPIRPKIDWRYCPIHIIHDETRLALPPIELELFRNIESILESENFLNQLSKLPQLIQKKWPKTKNLLKATTSAHGLDFKLWEKQSNRSIFSVRLSDSYRAHLSYSRVNHLWTAENIGTHTAMGHG